MPDLWEEGFIGRLRIFPGVGLWERRRVRASLYKEWSGTTEWTASSGFSDREIQRRRRRWMVRGGVARGRSEGSKTLFWGVGCRRGLFEKRL